MLGLETLVSLGKQASATNPTTLARQSLNVYKITGGQSEPATDDNILGGGLNNLEDPVAPAPGLDDHRITVEVPLCMAQFPFWLAAFFGTPADAGTDPDYTHDYVSGAALPYCTLEHQLTTGKYRRHFGLVGEELTIDLGSDKAGFGSATMTFVGLSEVAAGAALTGSVTAAPALDRPAQKLLNVIYNSVSGGDIMSGKIDFKRNLLRVRAADGSGIPYAVERNGISTLTGSIHIRYHGDTFYTDGVNQTVRDLSIELMRTEARGIQVAMANMRLDRTPVDISGPDGVEMDINFRAWQTTDDPALALTVLNSTATVGSFSS